MADKPPSFGAKHGNPRPVSSALAAAEAAYRRGDRAESLKALRRAVEAASDAELDTRALELAKVAADLATQMDTPLAPSSSPSPVSARGTPPTAAVRPPHVAVKTLQSKIAPAMPMRAQAPQGKDEAPPSRKEEAKKADRKSLAGEVVRGRTPSVHDEGTEPARMAHMQDPPPARKKTVSRADRAGKRISRTDEINQWPTEAISAGELPEALALRSTSTSTVGPITQAARVMVWREADGSVRVAAMGSPAPADAVEAMLAALDADSDLRALFRDRR